MSVFAGPPNPSEAATAPRNVAGGPRVQPGPAAALAKKGPQTQPKKRTRGSCRMAWSSPDRGASLSPPLFCRSAIHWSQPIVARGPHYRSIHMTTGEILNPPADGLYFRLAIRS